MKIKAAGYWTATIILALAIFSGGAAQAAHQPETIHGIELLGYPLYFITILGIWKILGAVVILIPRFPRFKEWAYAGIFFEMTGASLSHAISGSAWWHVLVTFIFAALVIISWALRPQSRIIGTIFFAK
jgi:DoxX-like family